jgi:hypothetical protein
MTAPNGKRHGHERFGAFAFALLMAGLLILVGWVQRRSLVAFFGPDDLIHIEQAIGLRAPSASPLRFLSQSVYFKAMLAVVGPYPPAFHLASLLLHLLVLVMLARRLRHLGMTRWATLLAVGLFGAHPLIYPTLLFAVNINEQLAVFGLLLALELVASRRRPAVLLAPVALAAAFFSKESVLLLPLLTPLLLPGAPRVRPPWLPVAVMFVTTLLLGVFFFVLRGAELVPAGDAYEAGIGPHLLFNASTYVKWAFSLNSPIPDALGGYDSNSWPVATAGAVLWGMSYWRLPSARQVLVTGAGWFILGGLPVFVLLRHTYANYLYVSGIGLAIMVAVVAEAVVRDLRRALQAFQGRRPDEDTRSNPAHEPARARNDSMVAVFVCAFLVAYALQADSLLGQRVSLRLAGFDMPADPMTRKAAISERAVASLSQTLPSSATCVSFYAAPDAGLIVGARSGRRYERDGEHHGYDLQREALDGGSAVRIFFPQLHDVQFISEWSPAAGNCALYSRTREGYLLFHGTSPAAGADLARTLLAQGQTKAARTVAESLLAFAPGDVASRALVDTIRHVTQVSSTVPGAGGSASR